MTPTKDRFKTERALPPVPSPSVVDTRIPQARGPSLGAAYAAAPAPPVTGDNKTGKITIEPNLKPSLQLSSPRLATSLSQLPRSAAHLRAPSRANPLTPNVRVPPADAPPPVTKIASYTTTANASSAESSRVPTPIARVTPAAPPATGVISALTPSTRIASARSVARKSIATIPVARISNTPTSAPRASPASNPVSQTKVHPPSVSRAPTSTRHTARHTNGPAAVPRPPSTTTVVAKASSTTTAASRLSSSASAQPRSTIGTRVSTPTTPVARGSTVASPLPRASIPRSSPVTAPRQSSNSIASATKPVATKSKTTLVQPRISTPAAGSSIASGAPRPAAKLAVRQHVTRAPAQTPTRIVKRESPIAQNKVHRPVAQPNRPAAQSEPQKRPATQSINRAPVVRPVAHVSRPAVQPGKVVNLQVAKPSAPSVGQGHRSAVKVENKLAVRAPLPIQGTASPSTPAISRAIGKVSATAKTNSPPVVQVQPAVAKVEERLVTPGNQHVNPVARNLFQTSPASTRSAAQTSNRPVTQNTKPTTAQVNKTPVSHSPTAGGKSVAASKVTAVAAAPSSVRRVPQNGIGLKPQRVHMKVVHPTPVVKTLSRPMATVISSQTLISSRSVPKTSIPVAHSKNLKTQGTVRAVSVRRPVSTPVKAGVVAGVKRPVAGQIVSTPVKAGTTAGVQHHVAAQIASTPVKGRTSPGSVQSTPARHASGIQPPNPSQPMSQLTAAHQEMLPSVPNMTPEILAAAVAAAAAVEPTPLLLGHVTPVRKGASATPKTKSKPVVPAVASSPANILRRAPPNVMQRSAPRPLAHVPAVSPAPVLAKTSVMAPAPAMTLTVKPPPVPVPMFQPATIPAGMSFRDGEHVTIWNRLELRKIAGNAAPLGKNLVRYLREHPDCEVFVNQDEAVRANRKKRKLNVEEAAAGEHIPIWNRVERRKIAGNASPLAKNLKKYLEARPNCEVYINQDVELKNREQEEQANRARSESLAQQAAAQNSALYPDPFADAAPPLDEWQNIDPEAFMEALGDSNYRDTASFLLGICNEGEDDDDINVAVMSGPSEHQDLDIRTFLESPEAFSEEDVLLPEFPDDFLESPRLTNNPSVEIS